MPEYQGELGGGILNRSWAEKEMARNSKVARRTMSRCLWLTPADNALNSGIERFSGQKRDSWV